MHEKSAIILVVMYKKGAIMMLIDKIIHRLDKLNGEKPSLNGIVFIFSVVCMLCIQVASRFFTENWYSISISGGFCLTLLLCASAVRVNKVRLTKSGVFFLITEVIVGASFIINGLVLKVVAYSIIGLIFALIIPAAQFSLATNDRKVVVSRFCMSAVIAYFIFLIANLFYGPVLVNFQYGAIMGNGNLLGYFLIIVIISLSYFLLQKDMSFRLRAFYWGCLISSLSMLVFTSSRTSVLAIIASMGFLLIIVISKRNKGNSLGFSKKQIITFIVITVIVPLLMFFMFTTVRKGVIRFSHWVHTLVSSNSSGKDPDFMEDLEGEYSLDYYLKGLDGEGGEDAFTSGRILIWKDFIRNVGVMGHSSETREVVEETRHYDNAHAHNVYLQVAYSAGIIAGIAYLAAVAFICVKILIWFIAVMRSREKYTLERLVCSCFAIGFAVVSLTSDGYMVYNYHPTTMFWMLSYVFMYKDKDQSKI